MRFKFEINKDVFESTMSTLIRIRRSAAPLTMRGTLNDLAYLSGSRASRNMGAKFILRNKYTVRGLIVKQATQRNIKNMISVVGHVSDYMLLQEEGGIISAKSRYKQIPTKRARIGKNIRKVVRQPYRMRNLEIRGRKYFVGSPKGKLGIFIRIGKRVVMLWDLSRQKVTIKKCVWFEPAIMESAQRGEFEKIFLENAKKVRKRYGY